MSKVRFYRSLDRSVQFFGIRGMYVFVTVAGALGSLALAFFIGGITNSLVGLIVFLVGFFVSAAVTISIQSAFEERALMRKVAMLRCPRFLRVSPRKRNLRCGKTLKF